MLYAFGYRIGSEAVAKSNSCPTKAAEAPKVHFPSCLDSAERNEEMELLNGSRAQTRTDKSGELEKEREEAVLDPKEPDQVEEQDVFLIFDVF